MDLFFGLALLVQLVKKWKASSISLIVEKIYWELLGGKPTCMCEQRSLTHRNTGHNSNDKERKRERNWNLWRVSFLSPQADKWVWPKCHAWLKHTITLKKKFQISYIFFTLISCQNVCEKREIATPPTQISKMVSIICRTMRGGGGVNNKKKIQIPDSNRNIQSN